MNWNHDLNCANSYLRHYFVAQVTNNELNLFILSIAKSYKCLYNSNLYLQIIRARGETACETTLCS